MDHPRRHSYPHLAPEPKGQLLKELKGEGEEDSEGAGEHYY